MMRRIRDRFMNLSVYVERLLTILRQSSSLSLLPKYYLLKM